MLDLLITTTILFVALRLIPGKHWILHLPTYLVLQTTTILVFLLVIKIWAHPKLGANDWALISVALIIIIWQSAEFIPYLGFSSRTVPSCSEKHDEELLSILVINVLMSNKKYSDLTNMVLDQSADVVGLVETDQNWIDKIERGLTHSHYPYRIILPREDGYGMCLLSKYPLRKEKVFRIYNSTPALHFTIEFKNRTLNGFLLHPKPPVLPEASTSKPKDEEFDQLSDFIGGLDKEEPVVVFGDLNDVAWSQATRNFMIDSGLQDPRRGRGINPTFPTWAPFLGFPLDQIFVNGHFNMHQLKVLPNIGSDHYPLLVELCLLKKSIL